MVVRMAWRTAGKKGDWKVAQMAVLRVEKLDLWEWKLADMLAYQMAVLSVSVRVAR